MWRRSVYVCGFPVEAAPIPCSPLKQLPVSVHDLCEGDVAGVETGGKLTQLTQPALAYLRKGDDKAEYT